jgi:hypothetical protein
MFGLPRLSSDPVFLSPIWLGSYHDKSDNAAVVSVAGSPYWSTRDDVDNIVFPGLTDYFTSPHSSALDVTRLSVFTWGLFDQQNANNTIVRKDGATARYHLYALNSTNMTFYNGTTFSTRAMSVIGARSVGFSLESGQKPEYFRNGVTQGLGNNAVTIESTDGVFNFGGPSGSIGPMSGLAVWNDALTAADFALLQAWSDALVTPRLQWPGGGMVTGVPKYKDNIQTARVSVANEASGQLSNTGMTIETGTWKVSEDSTGRYYDCVGAGKLKRHLVGADGFDTKAFSESGGATLTKNAADIEIDAGAGDKIRAVELVSP